MLAVHGVHPKDFCTTAQVRCVSEILRNEAKETLCFR